MSGLKASLQASLLRVLAVSLADAEAQAELKQMALSELLIVYLNWVRRHIHAHPRRVLKSRHLMVVLDQSCHAYKIRTIAAKLAAGIDVSSYLSHKICVPYVSRAKATNPSRRSHLDLLLNEWGIHHLHLDAYEGAMSNNRSRELLFAIVKQDTAFLINLLSHSDWCNTELVQVVVENWPAHGLFMKLNNVLPPAGHEILTPAERFICGAVIATVS